MKKFLVFSVDKKYMMSGVNNLRGVFNSREEASDAIFNAEWDRELFRIEEKYEWELTQREKEFINTI